VRGRGLELSARAALASWTALTCAYAALCSIPFVWNNLIQVRGYPKWVDAFLLLHPVLTPAVLALAGAALPRRRAWAAAGAAATLAFLLQPLRSVDNGLGSRLVMTLGVLPLLAWEAALARARAARLSWDGAVSQDGAGGRLLGAAAAGALCGAPALWTLRAAGGWTARQAVLAAGASSAQLALLFAAGAAVLEAARRASSAARRPRAALAAAETLLAFLVLRAGLGAVLLGSLDMRGAAASAAAWLWAAALLAVWAGAALERAGRRRAPSGELLWPALGADAPAWARAALLAAALAEPRLLDRALAGGDWNGTMALLGACAAWAAAFAALRPSRSRLDGRWAAGAAGALALAAWAGCAAASRLDPVLRPRGFSPAELMARASSEDPSLRLARKATRFSARTGFFETLARNTNISRSERIAPHRIELTDGSWTPGAARPPVFIFTVDSLRPDYLGAFNKAARFTPALDAFAADGYAFAHAYTAYGATGLSEPSIWAGSRLIHRQYVTPFAPMNSLERLADSLGYRKRATLDPIVDPLWTRDAAFGDLDAGTPEQRLFCDVVGHALREVDAAPRGTPLLVYSQPLDLNLADISRENRSNVTGKSYPGFDAAVASRVERIDGCFGSFIAGLKRRGLYDESVIVVMADHGDSIGEEGRWGHGTLFPEVLRIPLLIHAPASLKARARADLEGQALTIDVTPTLYQLLGSGKPLADPLVGRPLITLDGSDPAALRRPEALIVSSYVPAYGILKPDGRLFLADGVNFRYYEFDLKSDPAGARNLLTPEAQADGEKAVRRWLDRLNAFWGRK
jgi:hypothetical protein